MAIGGVVARRFVRRPKSRRSHSVPDVGRTDVQRFESNQNAVGGSLLLSRHGTETKSVANSCLVPIAVVGTRHGGYGQSGSSAILTGNPLP